MNDPGPGFTTAVCTRIELDRYTTLETALGRAFVAWNACGITALRLAEDAERFEQWYRDGFARRTVPAMETDAILDGARRALAGRTDTVTLDLSASPPRERAVLEAIATIASGTTRTFGALAEAAGTNERDVRDAIASDPLPLLIPTHRVVAGDCTLGAYIFGEAAQRVLLEREGVPLAAIATFTQRGYRYVACDDDGTFCLPTCGDVVTRAYEPGYRALHSADEAVACGLVPCTSCRPLAA